MGRGWIGRAVLAAAAFGASTPGTRADPASDGRFRAMVERPLFSPTRRPPPPPAVIPVAAPAPPAPPPSPPPLLPPDVALSGVIAGGGGGVALLKRPMDAAPVRLALGGQIDGWTVAEIHPRSVVLRREARDVTVDLPSAGR